jgi:anaerobic magnesium-protoporphyrin IX monomethyl ester cyclase
VHVLFIYPDICHGSGRFHRGLGCISSVLKEAGHDTTLLHINKRPTKEKLCHKISQISPGLIGFSTTTPQYPYTQLFSRWIKEEFSIPIICGGMHPTAVPEDVISDKNIDIICLGEGEYPTLELVNGLQDGKDISTIKNLWVKQNGKIHRNPVRRLIQNLDDLPLPDTDIFDYEYILRLFQHMPDILTGRGCPYNCSYCYNNNFRKLCQGKGNYVRRRSVDNVLKEIDYLTNKYKIKRLNFIDDTFVIHPKWLNEFCVKYSKRFNLPFSCCARADNLDREILIQLREAGCYHIEMGIESGNEWLRNNVLKRPMTNEQIVRAFALVHEVGIKATSFNIVGFPYETSEMIQDTINLNLFIKPDYIQVSIFYPLPGTELYNIAKSQGFLTSNHKFSFFEGSMLNLPTLEYKQINHYYRKMYLLSIDRIAQDKYPAIYPLYRLVKGLLGESLTYWLFDKVIRNFLILKRLQGL